MTFKKVWFGLGSRNGLSFLVAAFFFFPERTLNLFRELFMASERHVGAPVGLTVPLPVTPPPYGSTGHKRRIMLEVLIR